MHPSQVLSSRRWPQRLCMRSVRFAVDTLASVAWCGTSTLNGVGRVERLSTLHAESAFHFYP